MKPDVRMKKPIKQLNEKSKQGNEWMDIGLNFAYNQLYEESTVKAECPFQVIKN